MINGFPQQGCVATSRLTAVLSCNPAEHGELMEALFDLFSSLVNVLSALLNLVLSLVRVLIPWIPLLGWVGFWGLAVNWTKAFPVLRRGGLFGVLLLMLVSVLVWGSVAPPEGGKHYFLGLAVSNFTGKFIYVTMLTCIALLCGSAQLSGAFGRLAEFPEEPAEDDHGHGDHGHHGHDHGDHGNADHGHGDHGHGHDSHAVHGGHHTAHAH
ncbi:MAG: hypothetical protein WCK86_10520 [Planctomycetia bacterium]